MKHTRYLVSATLRIQDVFNVLNTMNLTGFSGNLAASNSFGQPSGWVGQAFGSGGLRAAQLGVRAGF